VLDGAVVGLVCAGVWLLTGGVVEFWSAVELGALLVGAALVWLELDEALGWLMSELLLDGVVDGVVD